MTIHLHPATVEQLFVERAVRHVTRARNHLLAGSIAIDEVGFDCEALNDCYADLAGILAAWAGRSRPPEVEIVSNHITAAAVEWRRQQRRSY
jgi:hypothetical protein